jgi:F-type H+-transporting ATPase subunit delta
MQSTVAKRYSRALFDAAGATADAVLSELDVVNQFLKTNADVFSALTNPSLSKAQRISIVDAIVKSATGMSVSTVNVLKLLAERNRFSALGEITASLQEMVDAKANRVRGQLTSAKVLKTEELKAIQTSLESITKKSIVLDAKVDARLLGGVVAQIGSQTFDGSLKNQLREIEKSLLQPTR